MNKSGIEPLSDRVLVRPDDSALKKKTTLIEIPDTVDDRYNLAQVMGTLIAAGPVAWGEEKRLYGKDVAVQPGERVMFAKFAGTQIKGADGVTYRLIYDRDVTAKVKDEVTMEL